MSFTLCTSGAAKLAAGLSYNSAISATDLNTLSDEAEGYITTLARYDVVTKYGDLTNIGKTIISRLAANLIGQKIINYDESGYFDAPLHLDILENQIRKDEKIIQDDKYKTFLGIQS